MASMLILDTTLGADDDAKLNPDAPAFVPRSMQKPETPPAASSSPPMFAVPTEAAPEMMLPQPGYYMDAFGNAYYDTSAMNGMGYYDPMTVYPSYGDGMVDEQTAFFLAQEDLLRDSLYHPPQQPKGNTQGRARGKAAHWPRS